ncbi:MAG: amidohydrolase family protein [Parvibaculaceae bacterium]
MDLIIRNARVLTLNDRDEEFASADIVVRGGRIERIGPGAADGMELRGEEVIDGSGKLAMPGLVNGHFHSPGNFMKGAVENSPLELFMLYEVPPLMDKPVSGRFAYVRTMLGVLEMLKQGVTAVHDDAFFIPVPTTDEVDNVMRAYRDGGMRATMTLDQPNIVEYEKYPFLKDLVPAEIRTRMERTPRMSDRDLVECYEDYIRRWHGAENGRLRAAVSCSAPQRVTPTYLQALSELSRKHDIPFDIHILETRLQRVLGQEKFGKSLVRYSHEMGVLDRRTMVIHAIWVDEDDIGLLAESGCSIAHNPVSNLKVGSGVMPFRRLKDAGINICLGNDEATTDDGVNLWTVLKVAGLIHNIGSPEYRDWPAATEILKAVTSGGARAMLLDQQTGKLAPGYQADIALVDLNTLAFTPLNNLRRQLVYCENGSSVVMTIVGGRIVMRDGKVLTVDEEEIKAEARELAGEFAQFMKSCESAAAELDPYYRAMYLKAVQTPVPIHRWAGPMTP